MVLLVIESFCSKTGKFKYVIYIRVFQLIANFRDKYAVV